MSSSHDLRAKAILSVPPPVVRPGAQRVKPHREAEWCGWWREQRCEQRCKQWREQRREQR
eukprot:CAMPEP_0181252972 /NCGR_PEP_ID=MMETSP1096-20121128/47764_1 /TAXON_ID=156174 ORGANISM="Chrysochromulina ericina, Strain CCMP281" /NCGR_SAMPLE_ID=MMETSP1096 /ASSEMBLY_ACC=CAM_ASM_000453 /LENGTH=59 /DNA_ID=CAMNT_0023350795 /DNA_START=581 /DNA_END=757 /DNA_ORIENTATION=+